MTTPLVPSKIYVMVSYPSAFGRPAMNETDEAAQRDMMAGPTHRSFLVRSVLAKSGASRTTHDADAAQFLPDLFARPRPIPDRA